MTAEDLNKAFEDGAELSDDALDNVAGGAAGGKTKKLVCDTCGYKVDANVGGVQTMTKHCSSKHGNSSYHVEE